MTSLVLFLCRKWVRTNILTTIYSHRSNMRLWVINSLITNKISSSTARLREGPVLMTLHPNSIQVVWGTINTLALDSHIHKVAICSVTTRSVSTKRTWPQAWRSKRPSSSQNSSNSKTEATSFLMWTSLATFNFPPLSQPIINQCQMSTLPPACGSKRALIRTVAVCLITRSVTSSLSNPLLSFRTSFSTSRKTLQRVRKIPTKEIKWATNSNTSNS